MLIRNRLGQTSPLQRLERRRLTNASFSSRTLLITYGPAGRGQKVLTKRYMNLVVSVFVRYLLGLL